MPSLGQSSHSDHLQQPEGTETQNLAASLLTYVVAVGRSGSLQEGAFSGGGKTVAEEVLMGQDVL